MLYSVTNFEKYNCRSDLRTPTWFKLHHTILSDPKLALFTPAERMTWVSILVLRSEANKKYFEINCRYLAKVLNSRTDNIAQTVVKLCSLGLIETKEQQDSNRIATEEQQDSNRIATGLQKLATNGTKQKRNVKTEICIRSVPREEESREEKTRQKKLPGTHPVIYTASDLAIAQKWHNYALEQNAGKKIHAAWTVEKFADGIRKIRKEINIDDSMFEKIINFAKHDSFWKGKACSPNATLDRSKNGLRKIENLIDAMPKQEKREESEWKVY